MKHLVALSIALVVSLAACSKDDRRPFDPRACEAFQESSRRFETCTKLEAADREVGQQSLHSVEMYATAAANAKNENKSDLVRAHANVCKQERAKLDQLLSEAGC